MTLTKMMHHRLMLGGLVVFLSTGTACWAAGAARGSGAGDDSAPEGAGGGIANTSRQVRVPPARPKVELPLKVGQRAPDFSLRDRQSNLVRLSDYACGPGAPAWKKKRQVLIDFFRTDCEPCRRELPQVIEFQRRHQGRVQVLMIALLEEEDGTGKLDRFLAANPLPFPVLVDAYETVAKKYIASGESVTLPAIFFIDENSVVRANFVGLEKDLEASLSKVLAGK